jgi:hypothetical protein
MGFFSRLLSSSSAQNARAAGLDVSGDDRIGVVGESHYQDELARLAGPKREGGVELEVQAVLVPEPKNPFDPNAVAIYINGHGKVGYLSREDAIAFQPAANEWVSEGKTAVCEAVILGGDSGRGTQFCVWLHIQAPG